MLSLISLCVHHKCSRWLVGLFLLNSLECMGYHSYRTATGHGLNLSCKILSLCMKYEYNSCKNASLELKWTLWIFWSNFFLLSNCTIPLNTETLKCLNAEMLKCWMIKCLDAGMLIWWNAEMMECWNDEILKCWTAKNDLKKKKKNEILKYWNAEILKYSNAEFLKCWRAEMLKCWNTATMKLPNYEMVEH